MPKKVKSVEEHLEAIELLVAGLLLDNRPDVKTVAKIIGVSDNVLTELFPASKNRNKLKTNSK